mmetsp:Transcript_46916/g.116957  ORF Transcript_46916/g.116957 Transcript_46916/m.116957 type:complete len:91 (-) Transcript_46916:105-377(-)
MNSQSHTGQPESRKVNLLRCDKCNTVNTCHLTAPECRSHPFSQSCIDRCHSGALHRSKVSRGTRPNNGSETHHWPIDCLDPPKGSMERTR